MQQSWFKVALLNFFIAICIGALLRYAFVEEISWLVFYHWLHAHSHVAMLGWVYLALFVLIIHFFLPPENRGSVRYKWLFWLTQVSVAGMLIAFPLQGYGGWSIGFSCLHILLSYAFTIFIWKDLRRPSTSGGTPSWSERFIRTALLLMVLSTLATWAIIPIIASGRAGSALYYGAVQFYLHFQFNGWFIFAVLGIFFKTLEHHQVELPAHRMRYFYWLLLISCFLTFALAVTWSTPLPFLFFLNSLGVSIQMGALLIFLIVIRQHWEQLKNIFPPGLRLFMLIALFAFVVKILIQTAVVIPQLATVAYTIRNFVIGFLHLMLLGMISCFLLGIADHQQLIQLKSRWVKTGVFLFLTGFLLSEGILFLQGTMFWGALGFLPYYYELLFAVSVLMPIGIGLILLAQYGRRPQSEK